MCVFAVPLIWFTVIHFTQCSFVIQRRNPKQQQQQPQLIRPTSKSFDDDVLICNEKNPCPCEMQRRIETKEGARVEWVDFKCKNDNLKYGKSMSCKQLQSTKTFCEDYEGIPIEKTITVTVQHGCELRFDNPGTQATPDSRFASPDSGYASPDYRYASPDPQPHRGKDELQKLRSSLNDVQLNARHHKHHHHHHQHHSRNHRRDHHHNHQLPH